MSALLAPTFDRVAAPHPLRAQWQRDTAPAGVAAEPLSSLEALPWLAPSGLGTGMTSAYRSPAGQERIGLMLHLGLAASLAVLAGGAWYASSGKPAVPPVPAMPQTLTTQDTMPADSVHIAAITASDGAAATEQSAAALVDARTDPVAAPPLTQRNAAATRPKPVVAAPGSGRTLAPVRRIVQAPPMQTPP